MFYCFWKSCSFTNYSVSWWHFSNQLAFILFYIPFPLLRPPSSFLPRATPVSFPLSYHMWLLPPPDSFCPARSHRLLSNAIVHFCPYSSSWQTNNSRSWDPHVRENMWLRLVFLGCVASLSFLSFPAANSWIKFHSVGKYATILHSSFGGHLGAAI